MELRLMFNARRVPDLALAIGMLSFVAAPVLADSPLSALESREAEQIARILGLDAKIDELRNLRNNRKANAPTSLEEVIVRQELLESIQRASLDVDGVLAELASERNQLGDLLTTMQGRRDRTVGRLNAAALLAGSGVSAAVSATQFHSMSDRTQDIGDGIGIGSGVAATILSILAVRQQRGPSASVGAVPNMLAPLLGGAPVLNTYYPPSVMRYLEALPVGDQNSGSRIEQLKAAWAATGRLDASSASAGSQKIRAVTSSQNPAVKVSIQDITDRIAMLGDLMGRVSLMKRDLGLLMSSYIDPAR